MPLVAIVVPFLNEGQYLQEAVESVLAQTFSDWELVLVDDGSQAPSTAIARTLTSRDSRIRYIDHTGHENLGRSASRNLGVAVTESEFVAFLDSDDLWSSNALADQVEIIEAMPDVALVCGALMYWHSWDPASTMKDRTALTGGLEDQRIEPPDALLRFYPLGRGATAGVHMLIRRSAFAAVGGFEESFRARYDDQALLAKIYLRYPIYVSSQCWYHYRQHSASCTKRTTPNEWSNRRRDYLSFLADLDDRGEVHDARVRRVIGHALRALPIQSLAYHLYYRVPSRVKWIRHRLTWRAGRSTL